MDRRERQNNPEEALRIALEGARAGIWTALPGIVQSFDPGAMTCSVQPAVSGQARSQNGDLSSVNLPVLLDCPVVFPTGGGCTLTFPIKQGDECLVVFASRCIDSWWQQGGVQGQAEVRMHDLSDGFVLAGPRSQPRVLSPSVNTSTAQMRSDDGQAFVEIDPASHLVRVRTTGKVTIDADSDILIKSGSRIDLQAPIIQNTAATSFGATAPAISFFGNMSWLGYTGGAGTVTMNNMNWSVTGGSMSFNGVATAYVGGTFTYNGKNMTDTHVHGNGNGGANTTGVV